MTKNTTPKKSALMPALKATLIAFALVFALNISGAFLVTDSGGSPLTYLMLALDGIVASVLGVSNPPLALVSSTFWALLVGACVLAFKAIKNNL